MARAVPGIPHRPQQRQQRGARGGGPPARGPRREQPRPHAGTAAVAGTRRVPDASRRPPPPRSAGLLTARTPPTEIRGGRTMPLARTPPLTRLRRSLHPLRVPRRARRVQPLRARPHACVTRVLPATDPQGLPPTPPDAAVAAVAPLARSRSRSRSRWNPAVPRPVPGGRAAGGVRLQPRGREPNSSASAGSRRRWRRSGAGPGRRDAGGMPGRRRESRSAPSRQRHPGSGSGGSFEEAGRGSGPVTSLRPGLAEARSLEEPARPRGLRSPRQGGFAPHSLSGSEHSACVRTPRPERPWGGDRDTRPGTSFHTGHPGPRSPRETEAHRERLRGPGPAPPWGRSHRRFLGFLGGPVTAGYATARLRAPTARPRQPGEGGGGAGVLPASYHGEDLAGTAACPTPVWLCPGGTGARLSRVSPPGTPPWPGKRESGETGSPGDTAEDGACPCAGAGGTVAALAAGRGVGTAVPAGTGSVCPGMMCVCDRLASHGPMPPTLGGSNSRSQTVPLAPHLPPPPRLLSGHSPALSPAVAGPGAQRGAPPDHPRITPGSPTGSPPGSPLAHPRIASGSPQDHLRFIPRLPPRITPGSPPDHPRITSGSPPDRPRIAPGSPPSRPGAGLSR
ncbi:basic proline-rich protein-like [Vidua macroura]|uniref:basic proline-rich protein-like n=1 Tax=Vidua macroura TaxID=187451 RepID=UPI0023A89D3B|nr:basic proline-rich protein-like [Vidua macroura]